MGNKAPSPAEDTKASSPTSFPGIPHPGRARDLQGVQSKKVLRLSLGEASPSPVLFEAPFDGSSEGVSFSGRDILQTLLFKKINPSFFKRDNWGDMLVRGTSTPNLSLMSLIILRASAPSGLSFNASIAKSLIVSLRPSWLTRRNILRPAFRGPLDVGVDMAASATSSSPSSRWSAVKLSRAASSFLSRLSTVACSSSSNRCNSARCSFINSRNELFMPELYPVSVIPATRKTLDWQLRDNARY